ncbi:MAG TPA: hypothetical protein VE569_08840, partial [Acidimicrobiia bacterium]|nr:hypothetical protein [Acidimicrobiia bacterium]
GSLRPGSRGGGRRWAILSMVPPLAFAFLATPANAAVSCHKINARGTGRFAVPGDPAFGTIAQIHGGGLLQGTTAAELSGTFIAPSTLALNGDLTLTTNRATLTVTVGGTLDLTTGEFTVTGSVTDSSGKLAGASGDLTFEGVQDLADPNGAFVETVTGEICVDLSPSD